MSEQFVYSFFQADHQRLDILYKNFKQNLEIDLVAAKRFFKDFKDGLIRHIEWEEDLLFPVFEIKTGMTNRGPTAVMRKEHGIIIFLLEQMHENFNIVTISQTIGELDSILNAHNQKEERVLYPEMDEIFSKDEIAKLVVALK
ncbi:hemerythrin domain-containing protein [Pleionea sediminis]|uniref:hemerythrin domain-containing protein n=1 Tax=Pleionea sediminis TaxID=2569479 RepID=UPI0011853769|nr:hemerythrin domain-containing protein [Pleionea sediminis]